MSLKEKIFKLGVDFKLRMAKPSEILKQGEPQPGKWYKLLLSDASCADGSRCNMYIKKGTVNKLAIVFNGGGVVLNEETALHPYTYDTLANNKTMLYFPNMEPLFEFGLFLLNKQPGILDTSEQNPFSKWNMAIINYATADFHVGNNDFPYTDLKGERKVLHCHGYRNFKESMSKIKEYFPFAETLLITGMSAGAFAVPALSSEIIDNYPDCKDITVYSDSALYMKDDWNEVATRVWNSPDRIKQAVKTKNIAADWYRLLMEEKGNNIRYLYSCSVHDFGFTTYMNYMNKGEFAAAEEVCEQFKKDLKAHITELKQINPEFGCYINQFKYPGSKIATEHCVLFSTSFTQRSVDGVAPANWLWDAVNRNVYDVGLNLLTD